MVLVGVALEEGVRQIEVAPEELIHFPRGMVGFEEFISYALFQMDHGLFLLQSVADPHVGFVTVDPSRLDPSYPPALPEGELALLGLETGNRPALLCVATLSPDGIPVSVNLRAPVVVNPATKLGTQLVLQDCGYPIRCPVAISADGQVALESGPGAIRC